MTFENSDKLLCRLGCVNVSGNKVKIAGKEFDFWTKQHGLPLHINFESAIIKNIKDFKDAFRDLYPKGKVCFSLKTYPHPRMAKLCAEQKIGADVVSTNELRCALEAGITHKDIDLNGNAKTHGLMKEAIENGVTMVADNIEDFKMIHSVAKALGLKARMLLRVSGFPVEGATEDSVLTANEWTKFGEHLDHIPAFIKTLKKYPYADFMGFHTHIGTQITELEVYLTVLKELIRISAMLKEQGITCKALSIGGGFPVQYVNQKEWQAVCSAIQAGVKDPSKAVLWRASCGGFKKKKDGSYDFTRWHGEQFYTKYPKAKMLKKILESEVDFNGSLISVPAALKKIGTPEFVIEPGRAIVADSGITLSRVAYTRKVVGHNLVNVYMGATAIGESLFYPNLKKWMILDDHKKVAAKPYECFIAGNLCFSGDMLSKYKIPLQRKPKYKETLITFDTGGTGQHFVAANPNSFPRTPRILIKTDGSFTIVRKRDTYEDIFCL